MTVTVLVGRIKVMTDISILESRFLLQQ